MRFIDGGDFLASVFFCVLFCEKILYEIEKKVK